MSSEEADKAKEITTLVQKLEVQQSNVVKLGVSVNSFKRVEYWKVKCNDLEKK